MNLLIKDTHFGIADFTKEEKKIIDEKFTFIDYSNAMSKSGFNERKVKKVNFAITNKNLIALRTGFLQDFVFLAKSHKFNITEIKDERTKFDFQKVEYKDEDLRKYFNPDFKYVNHQIRSLKALLKTNVGIIKAPTSSGKTEIIIGYLKITNLPTLILVDNVTLAIQTQARIEETGLSCGICTGTGKKDGYNVVSTIGSVKKLNLHNFKCVIVDECHIVGSARFQEFFSNTSYPLRFGFSATPEGNDKYRFATIKQHIGGVISEISSEELIKNDVMTPPEIHFIRIENCIPTPEWESSYDINIVNNELRNAKIAELANNSEYSTLVLYKIIEHGEKLLKLIPGAVMLSGNNSPSEREEVIKKFKNGEIRVIIASNIFKQGISINNIEMLIIASGGKSKIEVLQKIGRALRKHPGKDVALIYDFFDDGNKFTKKHSHERYELYKKAGYDNIIFE